MRVHGHRRLEDGRSSPTYNTWRAMKIRCQNPNRKDFRWYGARGIQVCPRWCGPDGFDNFLADMGPRPEGMTLDRIDVNWHYEPENCRWADRETQAGNRQASLVASLEREDAERPPTEEEEEAARVRPKWPELVVEVAPPVAPEDMPF